MYFILMRFLIDFFPISATFLCFVQNISNLRFNFILLFKIQWFLVSFGPFLTDLGAILVPLGLLNQSWCHINQFRWTFCSIWPFFLLSFYHNVPNCHFIGCHPSNFWWFYPIWADSMPFFLTFLTFPVPFFLHFRY